MSKSLNKVLLIGRLGKDPEQRKFDSGKIKVSFSLATDDFARDENGKTRTDWHNIAVWEKLGEIAMKYLKKGSRVFIEGRISMRQYEQDGVQKYFTEINARDLVLLDPRTDTDENGKRSEAAEEEHDIPGAPASSEKGDDLPF